MVTQDLIKSLLDYNPETGIFTWKHRPREMFNNDTVFNCWNGKWAGKQAGTKHKSLKRFYLRSKIGVEFVFLHHAAWILTHGKMPDGVIDHENGNSLDNRISNLRDVPQGVNCRNRKMNCNNTSGVNGVSWYKRSGKWVVKACHNWKPVQIGYFENLFDAICARKSFDAKHGFHELHGQDRDHSESPK